MAVGLGFVSICLSEQDCSPAGNVSVATAQRLPDRAARLALIRRTAVRNLENTLRILWFLKGNRLQLYRFATHLIPLATHPYTEGWAWWEDPDLRPLLERVGEVVRGDPAGYQAHAAVPQGQRLGVGRQEAGWHDPALGCGTAGCLEHPGGQVEQDNPGTVPGQCQPGMPAAGGHVERQLAGPHRRPLDQPPEVVPERVRAAAHVGLGSRAELLAHPLLDLHLRPRSSAPVLCRADYPLQAIALQCGRSCHPGRERMSSVGETWPPVWYT